MAQKCRFSQHFYRWWSSIRSASETGGGGGGGDSSHHHEQNKSSAERTSLLSTERDLGRGVNRFRSKTANAAVGDAARDQTANGSGKGPSLAQIQDQVGGLQARVDAMEVGLKAEICSVGEQMNEIMAELRMMRGEQAQLHASTTAAVTAAAAAAATVAADPLQSVNGPDTARSGGVQQSQQSQQEQQEKVQVPAGRGQQRPRMTGRLSAAAVATAPEPEAEPELSTELELGTEPELLPPQAQAP